MVHKKKFTLPLVNTHTHAAMIDFRGMAEDMPLNEWLEKYIWPLEKERVNPKFIYENTKIAIKEMQKNGIKVFNDMYFFEDEVAKAAEELKMHVVLGEVILNFPTPSARFPEEALEITEKLIIKYKDNPYVSVAVAPHSIYSVSTEILIKAKKLARKYNTVFHIHLSETKSEVDDCIKKNKTTPVDYMKELDLLDYKTVLIHCVWLNDNDINIISDSKAKVVHCPISNLKLGSGIAPVSKMIEKGIIVALGTDSAASSNRLDIWEAGKMAALLQKGINCDPTKILARKAVEMMTINGLKTLDMDKIDGKSIIEIENEILKTDNYNFLYEFNVDELNFYEI